MEESEVIIGLLGRMAFKPDEIREIVTRKKSNPKNYIKGYNVCDGTKKLNEIAKVIGVTSGTLSPIMKEWGKAGIIYKVKTPTGEFYKKLYEI